MRYARKKFSRAFKKGYKSVRPSKKAYYVSRGGIRL